MIVPPDLKRINEEYFVLSEYYRLLCYAREQRTTKADGFKNQVIKSLSALEKAARDMREEMEKE